MLNKIKRIVLTTLLALNLATATLTVTTICVLVYMWYNNYVGFIAMVVYGLIILVITLMSIAVHIGLLKGVK